MNMLEMHSFLVLQHIFCETEVCFIFCRRNASSLFSPSSWLLCCLETCPFCDTHPSWLTGMEDQTNCSGCRMTTSSVSCPGGELFSFQVGWLLRVWSVWISSRFLPLIVCCLLCLVILLDGTSSGRDWACLRQVAFSIWNQPPSDRTRWNRGYREEVHILVVISVTDNHRDFQSVLWV